MISIHPDFLEQSKLIIPQSLLFIVKTKATTNPLKLKKYGHDFTKISLGYIILYHENNNT